VSGCTLELAPAVAAASLLQSGALASAIKGSSKLIQQCPDKAATRPDPATRQALDDKVLCAVMCCCSENPNTGKDGASLYDGCASEVLRAADAMLGWKSRYKAQVGFDMQQGGNEPPSPFMHRGPNGGGTQPSQQPLGRAMQEIENFTGSRGKLRIPDVTIVDDPCRPPVFGNIERIAELKFGGDQRDEKQDRAYEIIAGGEGRYQVFRTGKVQKTDEYVCDCNDKKGREAVRALAPKPEEATEKQRQLARNLALGAAAGVAAAAAIVAAPVLASGAAALAAALAL